MPQSGVRYVVTLQDLTAPAFNTMNANANKTEASINRLQYSMNSLVGAFGVSLGLGGLVAFGKEIVDTGSKMEQLRNRILISSSTASEYGASITQLKHIVDDFKVPIEETYDSFGKLATVFRGTEMQGQKLRDMFEDISKVVATLPITKSQKGRAFYAIQEMFEEDVVQTRHFVRQLSIAIPGIMQEAERMTGTTGREFRKLLQEKDPNKQIDPKAFLPALFKNMAMGLEGKMDIQLNSIAGSVTDLDNAWIKFKDDVAMSLKPEIIGLITNLKDSAVWLKENKDSLIAIGKTVVTLSEYYLKYKLAVGALNLVNATYASFMMGYHSLATTEITDTEKKTIALGLQTQAINQMTIALERLVYVQATANNMPMLASMSAQNSAMLGMYGSAIYGVKAGTISGLGAQGIPLASAGLGYASAGGVTAGSLMASATPVLITAFTASAIAQMIPNDPFSNKGWDLGRIAGTFNNQGDAVALGFSLLKAIGIDPIGEAMASQVGKGTSIGKWNGYWFDNEQGLTKDGKKKGTTDSSKLGFTKDEVKGNRPQTYNVYIKEMNGNKDCKFELQSLDKMDASAFGRRMADILLSVTNDTQLRNGN